MLWGGGGGLDYIGEEPLGVRILRSCFAKIFGKYIDLAGIEDVEMPKSLELRFSFFSYSLEWCKIHQVFQGFMFRNI